MSIKCPVCRHEAARSQIAFITMNAPSPDDNGKDAADSRVSIDGSWGTKIEGVLRRVKTLVDMGKEREREREGEGEAGEMEEGKVVVFSSWNEVLDILCFALRKNSLPFVRYGGQ